MNRARGGGTLRRVLENAGWLLAGKTVGAVLSLVYLAIATRSLGVHEFGRFALVLATAQTITAIVAVQTWQIVVRFGVEHYHAGDRATLGRLFGAALLIDAAGAVAGLAIAGVSVALLADHFGWTDDFQLQALLFCAALLLCIRSTATGILRLDGRFALTAGAESVMPVMRMAGALVVWGLGSTVTGFLIAWGVAEVATAAVFWIAAFRIGRGIADFALVRSFRAVREEFPGLGGFAGASNLSGILAAVGKKFSIVIVGLVAGTSAAGLYRVAFQLGQALARVADILARAVFAELAHARFAPGDASVSRLFSQATRLSWSLGIAILIVLFTLGRITLDLIAGPDYEAAYPLLLLLGTASVFEVAGVTFEPLLLASGRAGWALRLRAYATIMLIVLMAVLLPEYGTFGAAVAMLGAGATGFLLYGIAARRLIRAEPVQPSAFS